MALLKSLDASVVDGNRTLHFPALAQQLHTRIENTASSSETRLMKFIANVKDRQTPVLKTEWTVTEKAGRTSQIETVLASLTSPNGCGGRKAGDPTSNQQRIFSFSQSWTRDLRQ